MAGAIIFWVIILAVIIGFVVLSVTNDEFAAWLDKSNAAHAAASEERQHAANREANRQRLLGYPQQQQANNNVLYSAMYAH